MARSGGSPHLKIARALIRGHVDETLALQQLAYLNTQLAYLLRQSDRVSSVIGQLATTGDLITDHGGLTGLSDDDHPQYLLASGARNLVGNMAANAGVTYDGVDVSTLLPVDEEVPSPNTGFPCVSFDLAFVPIAGSLKLYLNGQRLVLGVDYTLAGQTITITHTAIVTAGGVDAVDVLVADYRRAAA